MDTDNSTHTAEPVPYQVGSGGLVVFFAAVAVAVYVYFQSVLY